MIKEMLDQSINQLEGNLFDKKPEFDSFLIKTCYALSTKKLKSYTLEDLRIMISQGIGLKYLVPLSLNYLKEDLFVESEFYEGDLFITLLRIDDEFWGNNRSLKEDLKALYKANEDKVKELDDEVQKEICEHLEKW